MANNPGDIQNSQNKSGEPEKNLIAAFSGHAPVRRQISSKCIDNFVIHLAHKQTDLKRNVCRSSAEVIKYDMMTIRASYSEGSAPCSGKYPRSSTLQLHTFFIQLDEFVSSNSVDVYAPCSIKNNPYIMYYIFAKL